MHESEPHGLDTLRDATDDGSQKNTDRIRARKDREVE